MRYPVAVVAVLFFSVSLTFQTVEIAAADACSRANTANDVMRATNDPRELENRATIGSRLATNCAVFELSKKHGRTGMTAMAMAFQDATIAAMAMHLRGDDRDARKLLTLTLSNESQFIGLATQLGLSSQADLLRHTKSQTADIQNRIR